MFARDGALRCDDEDEDDGGDAAGFSAKARRAASSARGVEEDEEGDFDAAPAAAVAVRASAVLRPGALCDPTAVTATGEAARGRPASESDVDLDEAGDFDEDSFEDVLTLRRKTATGSFSQSNGAPSGAAAASSLVADLLLMDEEGSEEDEDYEEEDESLKSSSDDYDWLLDVTEPFVREIVSPHSVALAYSSQMSRHEDSATNHPERPERITMTYTELDRCGLLKRCQLSRLARAQKESERLFCERTQRGECGALVTDVERQNRFFGKKKKERTLLAGSSRAGPGPASCGALTTRGT